MRAFARVAPFAVILLTVATVAHADTQFDILTAFDVTAQAPAAPLVQGADGNFYGTTFQGGAAGAGTVFQLTPAGSLTVLYSFTGGPDGAYPYAGLVQGADGNFYGTTSQGGDANAGTVFQVTPAGTLTTLHTFTGTTDGASPYASLIASADGNFYGTTSAGGAAGAGTVFQLTPSGSLTVLYAFTGADDGGDPYAGVIAGADGNFYGTTNQGGSAGAGTVFQLTPAGALTVLHAFTGGADGAYPYGAVIQTPDGSLYGTTSQGGVNSGGVVFQLTPDGTLTALHTFAGGPTDGAYPLGTLILATDGNLYGTTLFGGAVDAGTVFQLTPAGAMTILQSFTGGNDGAYPYAGVIQASDGRFYGTNAYGGAAGGGVAFRLSTAPSLVTWNMPAPIVYGTRLGAAQLNATASVPGTFTYTPPAGTVLHGGLQTLTVLFTPADLATYAPTTSTVTLTVTPATPVVTWAAPAPIAYGTPLSSAQLGARANVSGTFAYDPPAGAVLGVGSLTLSVTFTPTRTADYTTATAAVTLNIFPATPVIVWTPAAVIYGTPLSAAQLNATANTPGTFVYDPPAGTLFDVGTQTLTATFTPLDTADYLPASASATVTVAIPAASGGGNEHRLQFTPASGARGLVVAGYALAADPVYGTIVIGNCSYYTVHSGSGRGGGYKTITTYYNQTCRWDSYGNLLSVTSGAPSIPPPLSVNGTQTIYASTDTGIYTGTDSALPGGFVYTPGSQYAWLTPNPYTVIPQALYTVTATLTSDGDIPLGVSSVEATVLAGQVTVASTTCSGQLAVGSTCAVTVVYDPTRLRSTTGLAYDTLDIHVNSDAGQAVDFVQRYTIVLTPANTTDGD